MFERENFARLALHDAVPADRRADRFAGRSGVVPHRGGSRRRRAQLPVRTIAALRACVARDLRRLDRCRPRQRRSEPPRHDDEASARNGIGRPARSRSWPSTPPNTSARAAFSRRSIASPSPANFRWSKTATAGGALRAGPCKASATTRRSTGTARRACADRNRAHEFLRTRSIGRVSATVSAACC